MFTKKELYKIESSLKKMVPLNPFLDKTIFDMVEFDLSKLLAPDVPCDESFYDEISTYFDKPKNPN